MCIALCTIVAQNRPDSFPPYPPDDHHSSDDVYLREGGAEQCERCFSGYTNESYLGDRSMPAQTSVADDETKSRTGGERSLYMEFMLYTGIWWRQYVSSVGDVPCMPPQRVRAQPRRQTLMMQSYKCHSSSATYKRNNVALTNVKLMIVNVAEAN